MMDHILQFDWNDNESESEYFVDEDALDNCTIEKILQDRFVDPLLSTDDDEEQEPNIVDWDAVFKTNTSKAPRLYVPGLRCGPSHPKLSVLTGKQHFQCLKVLCEQYPHVLETLTFYKPTSSDYDTFEILKEVYEKEQKEFVEWAKSMWSSNHCVRALRPKPMVESVYEAEFKIRAQRMSGYPKHFDMAAQIPLECTRVYLYDAQYRGTLIGVKTSELPLIQLPKPITKSSTVLQPCSVPEPCHKHPYQFILPNESNVSILPITEIHQQLAQYAAENGTKFIMSENAARCLVASNRHWTIPITVCQTYTPQGETCNVVVLDSEFSIHKEPAMMRTYRAMKHLLEHALIPAKEKEKAKVKTKQSTEKAEPKLPKKHIPSSSRGLFYDEGEMSSDEEQAGLVILEDAHNDQSNSHLKDTDMGQNSEKQNNSNQNIDGDSPTLKNKAIASGDITMEDINDIIGVYNCTCTDTPFAVPPRRSFKKWRLVNKDTHENFDVIIHCTHKAKYKSKEVILEPSPEYQLELGASSAPPDRARAQVLALLLREHAALLNVRVCGCSGDIVTIDKVNTEEFMNEHSDKRQQILNILHTTLSELQGLLPGKYLLQHEPSHGSNAFLHVARYNGTSIELEFDSSQLTEADEAKMVKTPPTIIPVLMPYHKYRRVLPCAFTPNEHFVVKQPKKPFAKQKPPPQAIRWPKKGKGKKKK